MSKFRLLPAAFSILLIPQFVPIHAIASSNSEMPTLPELNLPIQDIPETTCETLPNFFITFQDQVSTANQTLNFHLDQSENIYSQWYDGLLPDGSENRNWPSRYFNFILDSRKNLGAASEKFSDLNANFRKSFKKLESLLRLCHSEQIGDWEPRLKHARSLMTDYLVSIFEFYGARESRLGDLHGEWVQFEGKEIEIEEAFFDPLKVEVAVMEEAAYIVNEISAKIEQNFNQFIGVLRQYESSLAKPKPSR